MAVIPESIADQIVRENDIVEVINSYVPLKKGGPDSWKACCPFHQEKTPSFHVSHSKQLFYCFGCQKGGNVVTFIRDYLNLDYREAMENLAARRNITIPRETTPQEEAEYRRRRSEAGRLYDMHEALAQFYRQELLKNPQSPVAQYFATRAIPEEFAEKLLFAKAVAVVPGSAFGESGKNFIRCSYATSMKDLKEAIRRIREFLVEIGVIKD